MTSLTPSLDPFAHIDAHPVTSRPTPRDTATLKRTTAILSRLDRATREARTAAAVERVLSSACRTPGAFIEEVLPSASWPTNESGVPAPEWRAVLGQTRILGCECPSWRQDPLRSCRGFDPSKFEPIRNLHPPYHGGLPNPASQWFSETEEAPETWYQRRMERMRGGEDRHACPYTCGAEGCECEEVLVLTRSEWFRLRSEAAQQAERRWWARRAQAPNPFFPSDGGGVVVVEAGIPFPPPLQTPDRSERRDPNRSERRGQNRDRLRDVRRNRHFHHDPVF